MLLFEKERIPVKKKYSTGHSEGKRNTSRAHPVSQLCCVTPIKAPFISTSGNTRSEHLSRLADHCSGLFCPLFVILFQCDASELSAKIAHGLSTKPEKQTFALFVAWLQFSVVTDDPCVFTVAAVVCARCLFDAVYHRALLTATLHIVHMDGPRPCPKVRHHAGLRHPSVEDRRYSIKGENEKHQKEIV